MLIHYQGLILSLMVDDRIPVELEEIEIEKNDTEAIEYVPKDKVTLI